MKREDLEKHKLEMIRMDDLIDKMEEAIKYNEFDPSLAEVLNVLVCEVADKTMQVIDRIFKLENSLHRILLFERYINLKDNFEIAHILDYSYTYVSKVMAQAIEELEKLGK